LSSPAQIESAWLAEVHFRDRDEWTGQGRWYQVDDEFEVQELEVLETENAYRAVGAVTMTISWFSDEELTIEADTGVPYDLRIVVAGEFRFAPGLDESHVETWLDYNGSYLLWPYARAQISTITGLGRLPALTIPTAELEVPPDIDSEEDALPEPAQGGAA